MAFSELINLTVIVVTFNSAHCMPALGQCLSNFPNVIVVDNHSDDETVAETQRNLPQALVITNTRNLGFGAANNLGLQRATTPYCLLLNPDCELSYEGAAQLLKTAQSFPSAALIAPQLLKRNKELDINYRWVNTLWTSRGPRAEGICSVGFACGAAWLLNMSIMKQVGYFDERFFLYYEDDDLCHRIFNQKLCILIDPSVHLLHASRGSVKGTRPYHSEYLRGFHHAQSKITFAKKYQGESKARRLRLITLASAIASMPLRLLAFSPKHLARLSGRITGLISLK